MRVAEPSFVLFCLMKCCVYVTLHHIDCNWFSSENQMALMRQGASLGGIGYYLWWKPTLLIFYSGFAFWRFSLFRIFELAPFLTGISSSDYAFIENFCGEVIEPAYFVPGRYALLVFTSDASLVASGASFTFMKASDRCTLTYDHRKGFTYFQLGRDFINLFYLNIWHFKTIHHKTFLSFWIFDFMNKFEIFIYFIFNGGNEV